MTEYVILVSGLAFAGVLAGCLAGLFGIGGGAILVPILMTVFPLTGVHPDVVAHLAVGTSLLIIIPTAFRSYKSHQKRGAGNEALLKQWRLWVPLGVVLASLVVAYVPGDALRLVFSAVASVIAMRMLFNLKSFKLADELPGQKTTNGVGFGIGVLSTFMGIGGGNLNNLFMTSFGQSIHQAVATSAGLGILIAIPASLGYIYAGWGMENLPLLSLGFVNLLAAAIVIPFSTLSAPLGAKLAHRLSARQLELGFGVFLVIVAIRLLLDVVV